MRKDDYLDSIRSKKFKIYLEGEELDNLVDDPRFQAIVKVMERNYELPFDPEYQELIFDSALVNKKITLWTSLL
ncbi:MAG: 4-hydroxybutyryl-CoA dehydratase, partial [Deltaproteobacteria bacterium]|nr:4-hydroxybutyryl-CoA dehydratase [Deltaproteobacteria bacterium]